MKRFLSALLTVALLLSLFTGVASAAKPSDAAGYLQEYVMKNGEFRSDFVAYIYDLPATSDCIGTATGSSFCYDVASGVTSVTALAFGTSVRFEIPMSGVITVCLASSVGNEEWIPIVPETIRADTKLSFMNFVGTENEREFTEQYLSTAFHRLLGHIEKVLKTGGYSLSDLGFVNYTPYDSVCYYLNECPGGKFSDMPAGGTWAHDPIDWAVKNAITTGTSATTFSPEMGCSRAQIVTLLWRAAGSPDPNGVVIPFFDVPHTAYYYDAIKWASGEGIVQGTGPNSFDPDRVCTRAEVVTFLWRANGSPSPETDDIHFTDVEEGSYYEDAVKWAVSKGITNGTSENTFSPNQTCSRAQVVTFLYRAIEIPRLVEEGYLT